MKPADPIDFLRERERRIVRKHQSGTYVRLQPLLDELGIIVVEEDLPNRVSGYAIYDEGRSPSGFVIVVNKNHPPVRRRFTASHELGHCLLHPDQVRCRSTFDEMKRDFSGHRSRLFGDAEFDPISPEEEQANSFAECLLLPYATIEKLKSRGTWRFKDLARAMGVSAHVVRRRVNSIKVNRRQSHLGLSRTCANGCS